MLRAVAPEAASAKLAALTSDAWSFQRGALMLIVPWLAENATVDEPWVWSVGDAHLGNFATLCVGARKEQGRIPATFGLADIDDEHLSPWPWDLLRFLASLAVAREDLGRTDLADLAECLRSSYQDTLTRLSEGDHLATRIDLTGLPEAVKDLLEHANREKGPAKHLARYISGDSFRTSDEVALDAEEIATLLSAWEKESALPPHRVLAGAKRLSGGGVGSIGRRRWFFLIEEAHHERRLLEWKERRPSLLSRVIPTTPFGPSARPPILVPMGGDPFQRTVRLASGELLVRTRCHARATLDATTLDDGDLLRLMHLIGQLLATFHGQGMAQLLDDPRPHLQQVARATAAWDGRLVRRTRKLVDYVRECRVELMKMVR